MKAKKRRGEKIMTFLSDLVNFAATGAAGTDTAAGGGTMGIGVMIAYIVVILAFFYFIAIKPQKKQNAQHEEMVKKLKAGDSIMTSSGFYGTVVAVDDDTVIVEFGNNKNCRIPMHVKAIAEVESSDEAYEKEDTSAEEETSEEKASLFGKKKK